MGIKENNMSKEYNPERWEIIGDGKRFKVFGSWAGGYLGSDSWRLSSGLQKIEEDPADKDFYLMHNYSGSIYRCHKKGGGITGGYNYGVLSNFLEKAEDAKTFTVEEFNELYKPE